MRDYARPIPDLTISEECQSVSTSTIDHLGVPVAAEEKGSRAHNIAGLFGKIPTRFFKIAGGSLVVFAGAYAITSQQGYVSSNEAVISAQVVSLRVPIEGYVSGLQLNVSDKVPQGKLLGQVTNLRVDESSTLGFDERRAEAAATAQADLSARKELLQQKQDLLKRLKEHDTLTAQRIHELIEQSKKLYDSKVAVKDEAERKLNRAQQLFAEGIISRNDLEIYQEQYEVATREAEAQQSALTALHTEGEAAKQGLSAQATENDVPYSRQRVDDINLRLADIGRSLSISTAQAHTSAELGQFAKEHTDALQSANLLAPISGMVWKLGAAEGEHVGTGDMVAEFVDCSSSFLLVAIPQNQVPDVALGSTAQFRLSGESKDRRGQVVAIESDGDSSKQGNLAVLPNAAPGKTRTAWIRVKIEPTETSDGQCLVGRTARVLLPTSNGLLAHLKSFR